MAGVPEVEVTGQEEALPAAQQPRPPALTGLGGGLSEVGKELAATGVGAYHRASEIFAQDVETKFQDGALALRDKYQTLPEWKAVQAHEEYTKNLFALRSELAKSIPNQYGQILYNNNTLRTARIIQESLDRHFETQNAAYETGVYKRGLASNLRMLADGDLEKLADVEKKARAWASLRLDPAHVDDFVKSEMFKAADSALSGKNIKNDPKAMQGLFDAFDEKGWIAPDVRDRFEVSKGRAVAADMMSKLERVDSRGNPNPLGMPDETAFTFALGSVDAGTAAGRSTRAEMQRILSQQGLTFTATGRQMQRSLADEFTQSDKTLSTRVTDSPKFGLLESLHPDMARSLRLQAQTDERAKGAQARRVELDAQRKMVDALGDRAQKMAEADPYRFQQIKPEDLVPQEFRSHGSAFYQRSVAAVAKYQKAIQNETTGPLLKTLDADVEKALKTYVPKNVEDQQQDRGQLRALLRQRILDGALKSPDEVSTWLKDEYTKVKSDDDSLFGTDVLKLHKDFADLKAARDGR